MMVASKMALGSVLLAGLILLNWLPASAWAAQCRPLTAPVSGEGQKYSVVARVGGVMAFADIACAVYWRGHELCATELSDFQFTAQVFDYYSGEEALMTGAFFVVGSGAEKMPVAFATREGGERFVAASGGELLNFEELVAHPFK